MKFKKLYPRIYLVTSEDLSNLGMMFCRMQEFYESPHPSYKGQIFSLEIFLSWYQKKYDKNYLTEWEGYNLPSSVIHEFRSQMDELLQREPTFPLALNNHEAWLIGCLSQVEEKDYYVIGTQEGDSKTLQHELAHAFYNLNPKYRREVKGYLEDKYIVKIIEPLVHHLRQIGYAEHVLQDELNAYLLSDKDYLEEQLLWKKEYNSLHKTLGFLFQYFLKQAEAGNAELEMFKV